MKSIHQKKKETNFEHTMHLVLIQWQHSGYSFFPLSQPFNTFVSFQATSAVKYIITYQFA